jgi:drug/metabolite transporter (DMT)-like permease
MNVFIREVSAELHPFQIAFFRNFFAFLFILPWLASAGWGGLKTKRMGMQVWRAIIGVIAMGCWFTAITLVPLADAVALNFTLPLFATAGAAVFLSEKVGVRRWSATAVGFLGMLIILRPGFLELTPAMFLPIIAAVFMATSVLILKSLSDTENPNAMVFYMNLFMTPISLVPALFFWQWPSWAALGLLAMLGFVAMLAHLSLARAYGKADASAVMPFDYARWRTFGPGRERRSSPAPPSISPGARPWSRCNVRPAAPPASRSGSGRPGYPWNSNLPGQPDEHPPRRLAVPLVDVGGNRCQRRIEDGRIVGKTERGQEIRYHVGGNDEISERGQQHRLHPKGRVRIAGTEIGGDRILDKGNSTQVSLEFRPESPFHACLVARKGPRIVRNQFTSGHSINMVSGHLTRNGDSHWWHEPTIRVKIL